MIVAKLRVVSERLDRGEPSLGAVDLRDGNCPISATTGDGVIVKN
jgi:hypothetical protein